MRRAGAVLVAVLALSTSAWAAHEWPEVSRTKLTKAYLPIGFDNDDLVQIEVAGELSSSCERMGTATVKVDTVQKFIFVQQDVLRYPGLCIPLRVPYHQTVDIGLLPAGEYVVQDAFDGSPLGKLPVQLVNTSDNSGLLPGVDSDFYAFVKDAFVWKDSLNQERTLFLDLTLPYSCAKIKEVTILYYPDVIVVKPIAMLHDVLSCHDERKEERVKIKLKPELLGTYLIHVRSLGGRAVNKIVNLGN